MAQWVPKHVADTQHKYSIVHVQFVGKLKINCWMILNYNEKYEGHLESKERFAIKKYLLIIGKKKNMQVLSHTFTYFST